MTKKLLALPLGLALVLCVCSTSVLADGVRISEPGTSAEVKETSAKGTSKANAKLKADMEKLLADVKAGKVAPRPQQFPPTAKNNLSKTTKIAILAAAVGSAIFLIVLFHDLSKD
jgi:preprotein translocase subunit SecF